MAARVGTALSDENVLKHCADYRPIPMHLTNAIVDGNMKPQTSTPFSSKPLKYHKKVARPEHFDAFAKSLARNLGNDPEFRGRLQSAYAAVINAAPPDPAPAAVTALDILSIPPPPPLIMVAPPPPPPRPPPPDLSPELAADIMRLMQEMTPPRRSSRLGASRPEGFFSDANQAARGEGTDGRPYIP